MQRLEWGASSAEFMVLRRAPIVVAGQQDRFLLPRVPRGTRIATSGTHYALTASPPGVENLSKLRWVVKKTLLRIRRDCLPQIPLTAG